MRPNICTLSRSHRLPLIFNDLLTQWAEDGEQKEPIGDLYQHTETQNVPVRSVYLCMCVCVLY